jgi:Rho termination factor, N-terminal domain.
MDYDKYTLVELKDYCRQKGIRGYSKLKRAELIELIESTQEDSEIKEFKTSKKLEEEEKEKNVKLGRKGDIRVAKLPGRFSKLKRPYIPGYVSINVCSSSRNWSRELSPMFCGPVEHEEEDYDGELLPPASCVENFWQFCKVWDCDVNKKGELKKSYFERKREGFLCKKGIRHALGKDRKKYKILYSYCGGKFYTYLEARKAIYCPLYENLVTQKKEFRQLKEMHEEGYNILLLDYDGYEITLETIQQCFEDESRPFGHAHVLFCILNDIRPWVHQEEEEEEE